MEEVLIEGIKENIENSKNFTKELREFLVDPKGKVLISSKDYSEIIEGMRVKDLTSYEQEKVGITVLHVFTDRQIDFEEHIHEKQSQFIFVKAGMVSIDEGITFMPGQSLAVFKTQKHNVHYHKDTECVVVYMPNV